MPLVSERALAAYDEKIQRLQARAANARERAEKESDEIIDAVVESGAAFAIGRIESSATTSNEFTLAGMEPGTWIPVAMYTAGVIAGGSTGRLLKVAGRGGFVVKAYKFGREG